MLPKIAEGHRLRTDWEGLRLVIEPYPDHWQVFVYDIEGCEVLHTEEQPIADAAKNAA